MIQTVVLGPENLQRQPLKTVEDLHQEVDEVTQVMHQNLVKIRDREGKLDTLVDKSERLEEGYSCNEKQMWPRKLVAANQFISGKIK
uniref:Uncharacterized protein n=1 Tax=Magallana gigas TaxID=29159 RepID=K1R3J3_MAGGI